MRSNLNLELLSKSRVVNTQSLLNTSVDILKRLTEPSRQILHLRIVHGKTKSNRGQKQQRDSGSSRSTNAQAKINTNRDRNDLGFAIRVGHLNLDLVTGLGVLIRSDNK